MRYRESVLLRCLARHVIIDRLTSWAEAWLPGGLASRDPLVTGTSQRKPGIRIRAILKLLLAVQDTCGGHPVGCSPKLNLVEL